MPLNYFCHSEIHVITHSWLDCSWMRGGAAVLGNLGHPKDSSAAKTFRNSLEFLSMVATGNGGALILPSVSPQQL